MVQATTVSTLTKATELLAAHGVYALTIIFIFYQQARALRNLRTASQDDHGYFRTVHTSVIIATYGLMAISTIIWIYATFFYIQKSYVKGSVANLTDLPSSPKKADDPAELVEQITPESLETDLYSSIKNKDTSSLDGKYDLAWVLLSHESVNALVFRFQHHYEIFGTTNSVPDPSGTHRPASLIAGVITKTFKVDLQSIHYQPGGSISLIYVPNQEDPIRKIGKIYLRSPDFQLIKLPWEEVGTDTLGGATSGVSFLPASAVYASSENQKFIFKENGDYDPAIARLLRERLGSADLKTQLSASLLLVENGSRSYKFIRDSLVTSSETGYDKSLLINNLAKAVERIDSRGSAAPPDMYLNLAEAFYGLEDFESSAHFFDKAGDPPPEQDELYFSRGYAYCQVGSYEKGLKSYGDYLKKISQPHAQAVTYADMGECYRENGQADEAEKSYRRAIQLQPAYPISYNDLGYLYARQGKNLDEALSLVNRALQLDHNNPHFKDTKGWILYEQGKPQEAFSLIKEAHDALPYSVEIRQHFAELQSKLASPPGQTK
jgi:tetratricopeptide (TPR) repeat protein